MSTKSTQRFHEIDLLRGLACLSVLGFHYLSRSPRVGWMPEALVPAIDAVMRFGYLGVHLFFVISGFVILMSAQGATPRNFAASRVARLYPALWVAASITALTAWGLGDARFMSTWPQYLVNLSMVPQWFGVPYIDAAYWSLAVELHFYIYIWIVLRFKLLGHIETLMLGWLAISLANLIRPAWPLQFWLDAKWAPLFVAGGIFFLVRTQGGFNRRRVLTLLASLALALVYAWQDAVADLHWATLWRELDAWVVAGLITAVYAVFTLIALDRWRLPPMRWVAVAGALTYPVYILHQYFGAMVYQQLLKLSHSMPLSLLLTTLLVGTMGWQIHIRVEKTLGPRLRRWIEGPPLAAPQPTARSKA
ncbi:acyltransferase [Paucibacter sp. KBW04]|uniref:acyltransferase family protein n=1 Tax=Paucibacter sp. KBW04 TaxID=2153361 RepID=UPI0018CC618D|nr:acyltransferase [Paucibacter sp. KBW04]